MDQTYEKLQKEIAVMKSNQSQAIKDYGSKISDLDAEVAGLTVSKAKLEAEVKALGQGKDELTNILRAEAKDLNEEAKSFLANAKNKEKALDERTEDLLKRISEEELKIASKGLILANRESKVSADEVEIREIKSNAELRFKEAEEALYDAREYSKETERLNIKVKNDLEKLNIDISMLESSKDRIKAKEKDIDDLDKQLKSLIQRNKDLLTKNEEYQEELKKDREHQSVVESEAKVNYEKKLKVVEDQMVANSLRSIELDAGFSRLKEETAATGIQIRKLEAIKKQLSK